MKPRINIENMNNTTTNNNTTTSHNNTPDSGYMESSPTRLKNEKRKMRKVVVERVRRERMDRCLHQLEDILIQSNALSTRSSSSSFSNGSHLEKADILELTVDHVRNLKKMLQEEMSRGYKACLQQVIAYMEQHHHPTQQTDGVPKDASKMNELVAFLLRNMDSVLQSLNGSKEQMETTNCNDAHTNINNNVAAVPYLSQPNHNNSNEHIPTTTTNHTAMTTGNFPLHNNITHNNNNNINVNEQNNHNSSRNKTSTPSHMRSARASTHPYNVPSQQQPQRQHRHNQFVQQRHQQTFQHQQQQDNYIHYLASCSPLAYISSSLSSQMSPIYPYPMVTSLKYDNDDDEEADVGVEVNDDDDDDVDDADRKLQAGQNMKLDKCVWRPF
ncbi:hypothetical protein HELRODRAFT_172587 [Helobdella robusta]|uniref:BHLH domain-containing protein n=1 Tax=Helobdella robusta TaxID=6412 RepID=T1F5K1_HELRO|nr:hypothetical protein HELRODRAFT_172587 [Helobdella robusta]ESO04231.1 hypothetical protein HELRODRAFT_172587 [Helobdella robusta]